MNIRATRRYLVVSAAITLAAALAACSGSGTGTTPVQPGTSGQPGSNGSGASLNPTAPVPAATPDAAAIAKLPEKNKSAGKLVFATEGGYPPFAYYGPDHTTLQGFGIDLSRAIGQALGVDVEFSVTTFANFIPGVSSGKYDVAVSGIYDTPARQESVDFVDYVKDGAIVLVRRGNPQNLTPDTLCGKRVAASAGTASAQKELPERSATCTAAGKPAIDIQVFPGAPEATLALVSGRADAFTTGAATGYYELTQTNGEIEPAGEAYNLVPVGLAIAKGSPLTQAVRAGLQAVIDQGVYEKILAKWNLAKSSIPCATINGASNCGT